MARKHERNLDARILRKHIRAEGKYNPKLSKPEGLINIKDLRKGAFGPHYSLAEVLQFRGNFNSVDVDCSGELDLDEWMRFLSRMNQAMNATDAQLLFMHIDTDRNGTITWVHPVHSRC